MARSWRNFILTSLASSVFFLLSMVKGDELKLKELGQRGSNGMISEDTYSTKKNPQTNPILTKKRTKTPPKITQNRTQTLTNKHKQKTPPKPNQEFVGQQIYRFH